MPLSLGSTACACEVMVGLVSSQTGYGHVDLRTRSHSQAIPLPVF